MKINKLTNLNTSINGYHCSFLCGQYLTVDSLLIEFLFSLTKKIHFTIVEYLYSVLLMLLKFTFPNLSLSLLISSKVLSLLQPNFTHLFWISVIKYLVIYSID